MFREIKNRYTFVKLSGGLWASSVDASLGWKEWCTSEDFHTNRLLDSFTFELSENSKILHIRSIRDLKLLPRQENLPFEPPWVCLDFEKLLADGWDAIELHLSEEDVCSHGFMDGLYYQLYGWDCDSILIMNPDVVEVVG
jgi:hypothetical protein